jgi:hypothetical protein
VSTAASRACNRWHTTAKNQQKGRQHQFYRSHHGSILDEILKGFVGTDGKVSVLASPAGCSRNA